MSQRVAHYPVPLFGTGHVRREVPRTLCLLDEKIKCCRKNVMMIISGSGVAHSGLQDVVVVVVVVKLLPHSVSQELVRPLLVCSPTHEEPFV